MPTVDRETLLTSLRVERWARQVTGDYVTFDQMLEAAMEAATPLTDAEVAEALAAHPRIGEQASGDGAEARFSRAEQAASVDDDPELARRLAEGNAAYEERFGRVFLIRAAGRTRAEILDELERRLANNPITEFDETAQQLREIAALRLRTAFDEPLPEPKDPPMLPSHVTSHVLDASSGAPASGISVTLFEQGADGWEAIGWAVTDDGGRATSLGPEHLAAGIYQVQFDTGTYFAAQGLASFYPEVAITFEIAHADQHYHVPLLLSPFAYSTYRGS